MTANRQMTANIQVYFLGRVCCFFLLPVFLLDYLCLIFITDWYPWQCFILLFMSFCCFRHSLCEDGRNLLSWLNKKIVSHVVKKKREKKKGVFTPMPHVRMVGVLFYFRNKLIVVFVVWFLSFVFLLSCLHTPRLETCLSLIFLLLY